MEVGPGRAARCIERRFGESVGRLVCISIGCCYGKSLTQLSPRLRRMLTPISFPFSRATKKVAYEGQLEGVRIVPIQAVTASALMLIALTETYLFFTTSYAAAMILHL